MQFPLVFGQNFSSQSVKLYLGTSNCSCTDGVVRQPKRVIVHENYEKDAFMDSDIALIELNSPVDFTETVRPVCIEPSEYISKVFFESRLTFGKVAGCGEDGRRRSSVHLQEVTLPIVDREECKNMFQEYQGRLPTNIMLTSQMFCAGTRKRRTGDACRGDGGGAFVMYGQARWVHVGIVSFGIGCDRGLYGVYTNVGSFYDWIKSHTDFDQEFVIN